MRTHQDSRRNLVTQVTKLRDDLKRKTGEAQEAKDKLPFRSIPEMELRVRQLEAQIETGQFKLIEEKQILAEVSKLKKARRELENIDSSSGGDVGSIRLRIEKLRSDIAAKDDVINGLKARVDEISVKLDASAGDKQVAQAQRGERQKLVEKLRKEIDSLYADRRTAFEEYKVAKTAQFEARQKRNARNAEFDRRRELEGKLEELEEKLVAFNPETANDRKIGECNNLKAFFQELVGNGDDNEKEKVNKVEEGVRKVKLSDELADAIAINKKDADDEYFFAPKVKKQNKSIPATSANSVTAPSTFAKLPFHILSALADLSLPIPTSATEVPNLFNAIEKKKSAFANKVDDAAAEKEKQRLAIEEQVADLKRQIEAPIKVKFDKSEGTAVVVDN
jgi:chromosome segregation ATPase